MKYVSFVVRRSCVPNSDTCSAIYGFARSIDCATQSSNSYNALHSIDWRAFYTTRIDIWQKWTSERYGRSKDLGLRVEGLGFRVQDLGFRFKVYGCLLEKQNFDQTKFRKHLYNCFVDGELTLFPTVKERMPEKIIKSTDTVPIFSKCRRPEYSCARSIECVPNYRLPRIVGIPRLRCTFYRLRKSIESAKHIRACRIRTQCRIRERLMRV